MLTDDDRDTLRDWWDEDTTVGVESAFPIIARIIARERAAAWDSAVQAVAWCLDNGEPSAAAALAYVAENNPHRAHPEPKEAP